MEHQPKKPHTLLGFWSVYVLSLVYIFHSLIVAFINSTYMEQFLSPSGVGALFTLGSLLSVCAFLSFTPLLRRVGNNTLTTLIALLDIVALIVLGTTDSALLAIGAFLLFLTVNPLLFLSIDIYAESIIGSDESGTGSKRGLTLTLMSTASMLAPLTMGIITATTGTLNAVYLVAALCFLPFIIFLRVYYRGFIDPPYTSVAYQATIRKVMESRNLRNVCGAHFLLQMFFVWMIVYVPLYLVTDIGISWENLGNILAVAMAAYVLFEYPVGLLADRKWGEQEMMAIGFVILAITASLIGALPVSAGVGAWMVLMFSSRVGAALVETTTESYFFKQTQGGDADLINFFRLLRPLANVCGAFIGSICVALLPFSFTFFILGILMLPGILLAMRITDTR
jgi:fucose permease